jgi:hypothetical protein
MAYHYEVIVPLGSRPYLLVHISSVIRVGLIHYYLVSYGKRL